MLSSEDLVHVELLMIAYKPLLPSPGTKWCGTGNVANGFHDVGRRHNTDICCRRHDHCPVYIRPGETKYNLTNNAIGSM